MENKDFQLITDKILLPGEYLIQSKQYPDIKAIVFHRWHSGRGDLMSCYYEDNLGIGFTDTSALKKIYQNNPQEYRFLLIRMFDFAEKAIHEGKLHFHSHSNNES